MARILKRPMFRRGGMPSNQGVTSVRPQYMGGGMGGIMSGIVPRPDAGLTPRVGIQDGGNIGGGSISGNLMGSRTGFETPRIVGQGPYLKGSSYGKGFKMQPTFRPPATIPTGGLPATIPTGASTSGISSRFFPPTTTSKMERLGYNLGRQFKNLIGSGGITSKIKNLTKGGVNTAFKYGTPFARAATGTLAIPAATIAGFSYLNYPVYPKGHPEEGEYMSKKEAAEVLSKTGGATSMATGEGVQAGSGADLSGEAALFGYDEDGTLNQDGDYGNERYATKLDFKSPEVIKNTNKALIPEKDENKVKKKIIQEEKELQKKSDMESIYGDLLPMIEKELGSDPDDTKRQLYVQLAQAGANLLSQPGGDLVGAIGKATKDPISNVGKVLEKETATDREAKLLAFKLASDRASPGETGKLIQDLKNEGYSNDQISKIIEQRQPGAGYRASADLAELGSLQEELTNEFSKATKNKDVPLNTARDLKVAMDNFGMGASDFKVLPEKGKRIPGEYYFDPKTRKIGRLSKDGKKLIRPNEPDFMDQPEQE